MPNYQLSKIYKIVSNQTNKIYIGSTTNPYISQRFSQHKCNYKKWQLGKQHYLTSYEIVKYDDAKIILIESYPCNIVEELLAREQYWLDNTPNNCNKLICKKKEDENRKIYKQQYYEKNKEKNKMRYQKNSKLTYERRINNNPNYNKELYEKKREYYKKYNKENKDKKVEYNRIHRQNKLKNIQTSTTDLPLETDS